MFELSTELLPYFFVAQTLMVEGVIPWVDLSGLLIGYTWQVRIKPKAIFVMFFFWFLAQRAWQDISGRGDDVILMVFCLWFVAMWKATMHCATILIRSVESETEVWSTVSRTTCGTQRHAEEAGHRITWYTG